ncbi:hypothetical protein BGX28_004530 [Mortierella sp. GBA30]|nr:hypothetical protein BGX28_004530 [Mortierella sp. GBA30]
MDLKPPVPVQAIDTTFQHDDLGLDLQDATYGFSETLESIRICERKECTVRNVQDIQTWYPSELPDLKKLCLEGTPAFSFHLSTLHRTPKLEELDVMAESVDFIALEELGTFGLPIEELESSSRPKWSWDWSLPSLTRSHIDFSSRYWQDA